MDTNYWKHILKARTNRRRGMALVAGGSAAAALLAACGGDDDKEEGGSGSGSGALAKLEDSTKSAQRGGTLAESQTSDVSTWDQNLNGPGLHGPAGLIYSRLVKYQTGTVDKLPDGTTEPDFAQSFEMSPDGLTATFKMRSGLKWDDRAPTNGRVADSSDVKYSWDRWANLNPRGSELSAARNPDAPIRSVETPDANTAVFRLAYPFAPLLPLLGFSFHPLIYPKEAEGGFDPRSTARGTGAWMVDTHEPSVAIRLKRNPNWYDKDKPFLDGRTITTISDYAQGLAQFKTGALDIFAVNQTDIISTKADHPELVLTQRPAWTKNTGGWIYFGLKPGSPFVDDRVRRAMSMEIDREVWLDTFSNRAKFEAAGLPVETKWTSFVGPGFNFHLDPREKEIGEGGKNFAFNPAEAKKLLSAAGVSTPIQAPWNTTTLGGPSALEGPEAMRGLIEANGDFKLEPVRVLQYFTEFLPQIEVSRGNFDGVAFQPYAEPPDYDFTMYVTHHPSSTDFWMKEEDPKMTDFVVKQRRELDKNKRAEILKDFQKYAATKMYYIPGPPGDWKTFSLHQPWLMNRGYHTGWLASPIGFINSQEIDTYLWIDPTKKR